MYTKGHKEHYDEAIREIEIFMSNMNSLFFFDVIDWEKDGL